VIIFLRSFAREETLTRLLLALSALILAVLPAPAQQKAPREHRLIIQVNDNEAARMNLALNNAVNVSQFYAAKGEEVQIEFVAYGPGLHMLRNDTSPVKQRIVSFQESMPNVSFSVCGNTLDNMKKAEGKDIPLISSKFRTVPAGVTRIMELQEEGWSYIRP
jgi:intracellular sulfur oxidation DsrE/DsrF family protein